MPRSPLFIVALAFIAMVAVPSSEAQDCRWDGTAPWCAGECGPGETEETRATSAGDVQHLPSVNFFGNSCVVGSKAYCCSTPGVTCRWDGTAPACDGECEADENEVARCATCIGRRCVTGSKAKCCKPQTGSTGQPLVASIEDARYAAVWDKSTGPLWVARHGMTSAEYQAEFNKYSRQGLRLIHVAGYGVGQTAYYAAIWEQSSGPAWVARHGMTSEEYQDEFDTLGNAGYRLVQISGYAVAGDARYAGIWEQTSGPAWVARHGMTSEEYQDEFDQLTQRGYRLVKVSGFGLDGQEYYAAIWQYQAAGPAWAARHGMTSEQYQQEFNQLGQDGYRVVHLSAFSVDGESRFAAIWQQVSGPDWVARHGMTPDSYQEEFNYLTMDGYRLKVVSGYYAY